MGFFDDSRSQFIFKRYVVALAILLSSFQILSAAVDCRNPRTRQQRVVCANPELMELDRQLSGQYDKLLVTTSANRRKQLEYEQSSWEDSSGGCWEQVDCIRKRYADRIAAVEVLIAQASTPSPGQPPATEPTDQKSSTETFQDTLNGLQGRNPIRDGQRSRAQQAQEAADSAWESTNQETNGSVQSQQAPTSVKIPPIQAPATLPTQRQDEPKRAPAIGQQSTPLSASDAAAWATGFGLVFIALVCVIYPLPAIIAFSRRHRNRWVILAINLAFGATLIGWVIALVWALNKVDAPVKGGIKYDLQPHDPVL
jgi:uncharacterized protein